MDDKERMAEWRGKTTAILEGFDKDIRRANKRIDNANNRIDKVEDKVDKIEERVDTVEKEAIERHGHIIEKIEDADKILTEKIHNLDMKLMMKIGGVGGGTGLGVAILFEMGKFFIENYIG